MEKSMPKNFVVDSQGNIYNINVELSHTDKSTRKDKDTNLRDLIKLIKQGKNLDIVISK